MENLIRIAIADDDAGMRLVMKKVIARLEGYELVGEAEDGAQLLALYEEKNPQVIILDVEMPELTGVECARLIQDKDPRVVLIFATAHEKYMGDAFEVYAFDYLLKPFKLDRALTTLSLVRDRLNAPAAPITPMRVQTRESPQRLMVKHREGVSFIDLADLMLVQREDRSTVIYARGDVRYVTGMSMGELEEKLPKQTFFRTHKSYLVNVNYIDSIMPYGRWTYIVKLRGTQHDALITHERYDELQKVFA